MATPSTRPVRGLRRSRSNGLYFNEHLDPDSVEGLFIQTVARLPRYGWPRPWVCVAQ